MFDWWILQAVLGCVLACYGSVKCTQLDVKTGRRDRMALVDDYGSNRGYYWPYSFFCQIGFLIALLSPLTYVLTS